MSLLRLRRATRDDCVFVWETNGHPSVRAQSVRSEPIPFPDHERWFVAKLASADCTMWIAELDDSEPCGVVRCDRHADVAEISLAVAASTRGRGIGTAMIGRATDAAFEDLGVARVIAHVRPDNAASRRAFERAGFVPRSEVERDGIALLCYERAR